MIESVVIVRFYSKTIEAFSGIGIVIKSVLVKHVTNTILIHWHGLISAGKNIPSTHIFIRWAVAINLVALWLSPTVVILDGLSQSCEDFFIRICCFDWVERNAGRVSWPSCDIFKEISGVRVIYHGHVSVCGFDVFD